MSRTGSTGQLRDRTDRRPSAMMMEAIMLAMANKQNPAASPTSVPTAQGAADAAAKAEPPAAPKYAPPPHSSSAPVFRTTNKSEPNSPPACLDIPAPVFESAESSGDDTSLRPVIAIPLVKVDPPCSPGFGDPLSSSHNNDDTTPSTSPSLTSPLPSPTTPSSHHLPLHLHQFQQHHGNLPSGPNRRTSSSVSSPSPLLTSSSSSPPSAAVGNLPNQLTPDIVISSNNNSSSTCQGASQLSVGGRSASVSGGRDGGKRDSNASTTTVTPSSKPSSRSGSFQNLSLLPGLLRRNSSKEDKLSSKGKPKFLRQLSRDSKDRVGSDGKQDKDKASSQPSKDGDCKEKEATSKDKRKKGGDFYVQNSDDELYDAISSSTPLMVPEEERRPSTQLPKEMVLKNGEWQIASPTVVPKEKPKLTVSVVEKEKKQVVLASPAGGDAKPPSDPPPNQTQSGFFGKLPKLPEFLAEKRRNREEWDLFRTKVFVFFLFICILSGLITTYVFYYNRLTQHVIGDGLHFFEDARKVEYWNLRGELVLRGSVGKSLKHVRTEPLPCLPEGELPGDFLCMEWKHKARLHLAATQPSPGISCYGSAWEDLRPRPGPMTDCFEASGAAWYGAGDGVPYPMNKAQITFRPFVSGVFGRTIVRRYWLTSNGVLITVPQNVPLFVSVNKNDYTKGFFCLRSDSENRYYKIHHNRTWINTDGVASLNYSICVGESLGQIHDYMHAMSQPAAAAGGVVTRQKVPASRSKMKPKKSQQMAPSTSTPSPLMAKTIGRLRNGYIYRPSPSPEDPTGKQIFSQEHLLNLTGILSESGVNHAWIILDHRWQGRIGDFQFDAELFPNVTDMIEVLKDQGFSLGLEVTPFISVNSKAFRRGLTNRLLVQDRATPLPALTQFRDMMSAAVLDPTANYTQRWMIQKLRTIVDTYNVTQFVLDAGRSDVLPPSGHFSVELPNPDMRIDYMVDIFRKAHVKLLAVTPAPENLEGHCILHRETLNFTVPEQLRQVAHTVLNAVTLQVRCLMVVVEVPYTEPTKRIPNFNTKLMQRWLQFVSILPRSSFWPWLPLEWNRQLEEYRNATSITTNTNRPRNRLPAPMWTVSDEPDFHWIGDQFAMGSSDFVAPILGEQKTRDVVLPSGIWIDSVKKEAFAGPKRLSKFKLDFKDILYFTCISSDSLNSEDERFANGGSKKEKRRRPSRLAAMRPWS